MRITGIPESPQECPDTIIQGLAVERSGFRLSRAILLKPSDWQTEPRGKSRDYHQIYKL